MIERMLAGIGCVWVAVGMLALSDFESGSMGQFVVWFSLCLAGTVLGLADWAFHEWQRIKDRYDS